MSNAETYAAALSVSAPQAHAVVKGLLERCRPHESGEDDDEDDGEVGSLRTPFTASQRIRTNASEHQNDRISNQGCWTTPYSNVLSDMGAN